MAFRKTHNRAKSLESPSEEKKLRNLPLRTFSRKKNLNVSMDESNMAHEKFVLEDLPFPNLPHVQYVPFDKNTILSAETGQLLQENFICRRERRHKAKKQNQSEDHHKQDVLELSNGTHSHEHNHHHSQNHQNHQHHYNHTKKSLESHHSQEKLLEKEESEKVIEQKKLNHYQGDKDNEKKLNDHREQKKVEIQDENEKVPTDRPVVIPEEAFPDIPHRSDSSHRRLSFITNPLQSFRTLMHDDKKKEKDKKRKDEERKKKEEDKRRKEEGEEKKRDEDKKRKEEERKKKEELRHQEEEKKKRARLEKKRGVKSVRFEPHGCVNPMPEEEEVSSESSDERDSDSCSSTHSDASAVDLPELSDTEKDLPGEFLHHCTVEEIYSQEKAPPLLQPSELAHLSTQQLIDLVVQTRSNERQLWDQLVEHKKEIQRLQLMQPNVYNDTLKMANLVASPEITRREIHHASNTNPPLGAQNGRQPLNALHRVSSLEELPEKNRTSSFSSDNSTFPARSTDHVPERKQTLTSKLKYKLISPETEDTLNGIKKLLIEEFSEYKNRKVDFLLGLALLQSINGKKGR